MIYLWLYHIIYHYIIRINDWQIPYGYNVTIAWVNVKVFNEGIIW